MTHADIVEGIRQTIHLGIEYKQPVFVGETSFNICAKSFEVPIIKGDFYDYIEWQGIQIILCYQLHPMNFFTTPRHQLSMGWVKIGERIQ